MNRKPSEQNPKRESGKEPSSARQILTAIKPLVSVTMIRAVSEGGVVWEIEFHIEESVLTHNGERMYAHVSLERVIDERNARHRQEEGRRLGLESVVTTGKNRRDRDDPLFF